MNEWRLENILQKFIKGGIFLIPFLVLIVSKSLPFPYITGKNFFFMIVVEAILGAYIALLILDSQKYAPRKNILLLASTIFMFIVFLADIFGINPYRSFWSNYERMEGLALYFHLFIFFIISSSVLNKKDWFIFFHISIFVSFLVSGYASLEELGILKTSNSGRVFSTMGNPIYLAAYLFIHLFLAFFYFFKFNNRRVRFFYFAIFVFEFSVFAMTGVRSVFLGMVGAFMVAFFVKMLLSIKKKEKIFWGVLTVLIILIPFLLIIYRNSDLVRNNSSLNRFSLIDFSENTAKSRIIIWGIALKSFAERPIFGWGQGNFIIPYAANYNSKLYGNELWFDRTHNTILQWLVDAGIIGLAGYSLVIVAVLLALNKIRKKYIWSENQIIVFWAFMAGYFIQSFFVFDTLVSYFLLAAILGFLVCESEAGDNEGRFLLYSKRLIRKQMFVVQYVLIAFVFTAIIILGIVVNGKAVNQGRLLIKSLSAIRSNTEIDLLKTAVTGFKNALTIDSFGSEEIRMQLTSFVLEASAYKNKTFLENESFVLLLNMAIGEMEKETKADNFNLRPLISLIRLYEIRLMLNRNQESFDAVESEFRNAFRFKNYSPFYFYFAEYRINIGDNKAAASSATYIVENFGDSPIILNDAIKIYVMSGYHSDVWKTIYKNADFGQWPSVTDFLQFGKIAMKQNNFIEASKYGNNALKLTEDKQFRKEIFLFLHEAEKMSGNENKAKFYMQEMENTNL